MTKQQMNLNERAMIVSLSISIWEGRRKDKKVTAETIRAKHADQRTGSWWTYDIPKSELKDVYSAVNKARTTHKDLTLPWSNDGSRILPADMFMSYTKQMRAIRKELDTALDGFFARYTDIVKDARERLGDLFDRHSYPSLAAVRAKFKWSVGYLPIPDASDFRLDLAAGDVADIKAGIEEQMQSVMSTAMQDLWQRLFAVVDKMAERLKDPEAIIRDSLVGNVVELCDLLPKLNVLKDPKLEQIRKQVVERLAKRKPMELRENPAERKQAASAARDIAKKMKSFLGGA